MDIRDHATPFTSILYAEPAPGGVGARGEPAFFGDLNLDQVLGSMLAAEQHTELAAFFCEPLQDVRAVVYRHEVLHDLEREDVSRAIGTFTGRMVEVRTLLTRVSKLRHVRQRERVFLSAVGVYCEAVKALVQDLGAAGAQSAGLLGFRAYLQAYSRSSAFTRVEAEAAQLRGELSEVTYAIALKGMRVTVTRYEPAPDLSAEIEATFARFREGAAKDYRVGFSRRLEVNHIEGRILDFVADLHPNVFGRVRAYCVAHRQFVDETIVRFDREVRFYLAYLEYIAPLRAAGLRFCYPTLSAGDKTIRVRDAFDLPLARKLVLAGEPVVCNDVMLEGAERVLVVTGPNQGGKTTFARMCGQLHHLAALGLPVPGSEARLLLADQLFSHFEREEDVSTLQSKFEEELGRLREILERATPNSVLIMNESFTSTTLQDAQFVGTRVLRKIIDLDIVCVCVTFVDELASLSEATVSLMSTVSPLDATSRTFKVVRKPADGLAYALAIAEKHGVGYERLRQRIAS